VINALRDIGFGSLHRQNGSSDYGVVKEGEDV
jgi:hypothetical protein